MTTPAELAKQLAKPKPLSLIEQAKQMAADGYGIDDLVARLKIPRNAAKAFVFGYVR